MYSWRLWNNKAENNSRVSDFFCAYKHISNVLIPISIFNLLELHVTSYASHWGKKKRKKKKQKKRKHLWFLLHSMKVKLNTVKII